MLKIRFIRKSGSTQTSFVSALIFTITLFFTGPVWLSAQNTGSLSGYVRDARSGEPLIGAAVSIEETQLGAVTDLDGFYEITNIPTQTYQISATYLGYQKDTRFNVIIRSAGNPALNFELQEAVEQLNEVVVSASSREDMVTPLSSQTLSAVEIATYPGGNNDIAKVVQSLPGVAGSVGGFRNDIIIRGGAPNENVYYLDGVEIPNINHFSTQGSAGGPVGLINVSFVEQVDLSTSAFDARYDNPLSGVVQFDQRLGNAQRFRTNIRVSASETALTLEGPLFKGGRENSNTTFLVSGRRSYLQFLFKLIGLPILPDYWDYQYKINHKIDDYNDISLIGIGSIDDFSVNELEEFEPEQQATLDQVPIIKQWSVTTGISWNRRLKDGSGSMRTVLSNNVLNNGFSRFTDNVGQSGLYFSNDSRESELKLRHEQTRYWGDWILSAGLVLQKADYSNETVNLVDDLNFTSAIDFWRYGFFAQASRSVFNNRLDISLGLRSDANTFTNEEQQLLTTLSPRLSLSYALDPAKRWRLNASVGRYYKIPPYTILGYRNNEGMLVNRDARYIRSDHLVAGLEYNLNTSARITLEGFYKNYDRYPVSILDQVSLANKGAGFEVFGSEAITSDGKGRTYGLEFLFQQQYTKNFYGILAYTLFRSEFSAGGDTYLPSLWDSRQLITFTGGYKFKRNWELSLRYRYAGRSPFVPVDETATLERYPAIILDYSRLGSERLASFNQADIRIDKKFNFRKFALDVYLEFQNAFNQNLPEEPQYGLDRDEMGNVISPNTLVIIEQENSSVLPIIGLVLDF
ncbi:TonB-dependent receptor [Flavilitoribacter nigricans]|uniref:TonB-dependent receptor n=1 Tax=Flavilitoribacter nigricans (strain ATCC 23147 / DSM 23189 / NBRC 102662 / NCIMB 1420 / SS-2) TaxID=1122177 RepID=A0A2D0N4U8_FLAN2|nr:TonB-dependent receptor [Flavilitoribacter nigricans]PHN02813.1 TonB-dependent receptor [Flavilitoribacter nigricans DSM 23189 = NBRC 102662]